MLEQQRESVEGLVERLLDEREVLARAVLRDLVDLLLGHIDQLARVANLRQHRLQHKLGNFGQRLIQLLLGGRLTNGHLAVAGRRGDLGGAKRCRLYQREAARRAIRERRPA